MSAEDIEIVAGWQGESGAFVSTLTEIGFLDGSPGSYAVHDWAVHNPFVAGREKRIEVARRAAAARWSHASGIRPASDGQCEQDATSIAGSNAPNPTQPSTKSQKQNHSARSAPSRGIRIPDDFCVTEQHRQFAMVHGLPRPEDHVAEFVDHWRAQPGAKGTKLDWDATFRNWLRRTVKFGKSGKGIHRNNGFHDDGDQSKYFEGADIIYDNRT